MSEPGAEPPATAPAVRTFRPDIEGLRAFAVVLVVLYHAGVPWLAGGYVGVDVFFVLSGFLITSVMLREVAATGRLSLAEFYARRARRILPAAVATIVTTVLISRVVLNFLDATKVARDGVWAALFGANFRFASLGVDYLTATSPPSPLQHYWSLAIEEQFYVVWPLLFVAVLALVGARRVRPAMTVVAVLLCGGSLAWSVSATATSATAAYFSPFSRAWELAAGVVLALVADRLRRLPGVLAVPLGWAGAVAAVGSAVLYDEQTAFPGLAAVVPVAGTAAVIVAGTVRDGAGVERVLADRRLQWIGARSFALYLVHFPLLVLPALASGRTPSVPARVALVLLSVVFAALLHEFVENPVRHAAELVRSRRASLVLGSFLVLAGLGVAQVVLTFGGVGAPGATVATAALVPTDELAAGPWIDQALQEAVKLESLPPLVVPLASAAEDRVAAYKDGCHARFDVSEPPACWYGPADAPHTVALVGDSHALQWLPALLADGTNRVLLLTKSSCPYVDVVTWNQVNKRRYSECEEFRRRAAALIAETRPDSVVLGSMLNSSVDAPDATTRRTRFLDGMAATIATLQPSAGRVVVLGDTPNLGRPVLECLASYADQPVACARPRSAAVDSALSTASGEVARSLGATFVDPTDWFCTPQACPVVVHNTIVYLDDTHVSASYATALAGLLSPYLHA